METDDQQLEELKNWWKENGSSVITGIALGVAVLFGARAWFAWQDEQAMSASAVYSVMMQEAGSKNTAAVSENAGVLIADFSNTPYASLAAMMLAKYRIEENDLEAARLQLQWVLDNGSSEELRAVARLRLARVLVDLEALDEALAQLDELDAGGGQEGLADELRGDIFSLRGDALAATDAYQAALEQLEDRYPGRTNVLRLKLENVVAQAGAATDSQQ